MFHWTLNFLILAVILGILGFSSLAGGTAEIGKALSVIFLFLFLASLIRRKFWARLTPPQTKVH